MKEFERAHPVTIFFNLSRVLYLVVIPVLRGFVMALQGGFSRWLSGAWADVLVFLLMLLIAAGIWFSLRFNYDGNRIEVRAGLINRRHILMDCGAVTTFALIKPFFLRPIRAVRFRADTLGGNPKNADLTLLLTRRQADAILEHSVFSGPAPLREIYQPSVKSTTALALLTSNSLAGVLFISTFVSQSGKLLGVEFSQTIVGSFEEFSRKLAFGIPPAAAALAYILIAGWFIGFFLTFIRYKDFTFSLGTGFFCINGGAFTKRKYFVRYGEVNFIDIRRSVFTKLLRLASLYVSAVGYGKLKDDITCIVPTERLEEFEKIREKMFPGITPSHRVLKPERAGILRFLSPAAIAIAAIAAAMVVFLRVFPSWDSFIWFVGLMAYVPAMFFLIIQIIDFLTSGLSLKDGCYTIRYSSGWSLHTVVIPEDKVVCVELRQSLFQRFNGYCDVIINTKAETPSPHRCRNLIKSDLVALLKIPEPPHNRKE